MRAFAKPFPIARLSLEARVLYSAFLVFVAVGVGTSVWLYDDDGFGVGSADVVTYYRGTPSPPDDANDVQPAAGATVDVPIDIPTDDAPLHLEKSARQVVETFHFHAFTMPVLLLILGHIFMMTALSTRAKIAVLLAASTSTLLHLLLPPLVRFAAAGFAVMFAPSALVMCATWVVLLVWPLVEMWWPRTQPAEPSAEP